MTPAVAAALWLAAQQLPTFSASSEAVRVDVFVGRGDRSVRGLTSRDFEIRDDGVRQEIRLVRREEATLDAVLALDTSASVAGEKLEALKQAARTFLSRLRERDRTTLLTFSYDVRRVGAERMPAGALGPMLESVHAGGTTALHDAAQAAMVVAGASPDAAVVVLFSDGLDRLSWLPADSVVRAARISKAPVYTIFLADHVATGVFRSSREQYERTPEFLRDVAEASGGRLFRADAPTGLAGAFRSVVEEIEERYLLEFEPSADASPGWHELEVRVPGRHVKIRARRGYFLSRGPAAGAESP